MLDGKKDSCRVIRACGRWPALVVPICCLFATGVHAQSSLSIDQCVQLALDHSPATRVSAAEKIAAAEQVREARATYWPQLVGRGEYGRSGGLDTAVTNGGSTALTASIQALLFDGGQRKAQLAAARARLRSAAASERQRRADVALEVKTAYFAALAAREQSATYADAGRRMAEDLSALEALQIHGLATQSDVLRARQATRTVHSAGRTAEATLAAALAELTTLTGTEVTQASLLEPPMTDLAEPAADLIETSPTLEDAKAAAAAAQNDVKAARSERRGRVTFNADAGFVGVDPGTTFRDDGGGQFLLGYSIPIFDGGAIASRVAGAVASTNAAEESVRMARQSIEITLARTSVEAARARKELEVWTHQLPDSETAYQLMLARFAGGGDVRLLEVIDAQNQLIDARLNVIQAQLSRQLAVAERERILGRVFSP